MASPTPRANAYAKSGIIARRRHRKSRNSRKFVKLVSDKSPMKCRSYARRRHLIYYEQEKDYMESFRRRNS